MTVKRRVLVVGVVAAFLLATPGWASARPIEGEAHCVVNVIDELETRELVASKPTCFATFADAVSMASGGTISLAESSEGSVMFEDANLIAAMSSFALGIHFDGSGGSGSSITVVGSSCTGGWWNTGSSWSNRISSSYNGCSRLRHYNLPNKGGSFQDTYGAGTTNNLSTLNNMAESVSYH